MITPESTYYFTGGLPLHSTDYFIAGDVAPAVADMEVMEKVLDMGVLAEATVVMVPLLGD